VGSLTGIDTDEHALEAARGEARRRNIDIDLIHAGIEDLPYGGTPFDVVTIGRAHAFLPRVATLARLGDLVAAEGKIVICGTMTHDGQSGPWAGAFRAAGRRWGRRGEASPKQFMGDSGFARAKKLVFLGTRAVPVEHLLFRSLAYSSTTPDILGARQDQYLEDIRSAIVPYAVEGMLRETIMTAGIIYRRRM
jgi:hypothetical protein